MVIKFLKRSPKPKERLAEYRPQTDTIAVWVDTIRAFCKKHKQNFHDMMALVLWHEEAHYLQHKHGLEFCDKTLPALQVEANGYAMHKFLKHVGRQPQAYIGQWR